MNRCLAPPRLPARLLFRLAACCIAAFALLAPPSSARAQIGAAISKRPQWYSGTNCGFSGDIWTATPGTYLTIARIYVNGEITAFYAADPNNPQSEWDAVVTFDSTHFGDGADVTVSIMAINNLGETNSFGHTAPAYNKAFVYGNVSPNVVAGGLGDLTQGRDAATYVSARLGPTNHTVQPASADQCKQLKADIVSALPVYTVFYGWSHGTAAGGDAFGDSAAHANDDPAAMDAHWFLPGEVSNAIDDMTNGKTALHYPSYNFVFLDTCDLGSDDNMALGFNIANGDIDRAFVGWPTAMADLPHITNWTNRLFQYLAAGYELNDAITQANLQQNGGPAQDVFLAAENPVTYGDLHYKLHGVYLGGSPSTAWWR